MRIQLTILYFFLVLPVCAQTSDDYRNKKAIVSNRVKNQISWDYKYKGDKPENKGVKTSVTTFSTSGEVVQTNALNPSGATTDTEKYSLDSKGNKIEYTRISGDGSYQKKYVYNDKNLLIEESGFDGVENFKNQYLYSPQGEMAEIRYQKGSVLIEKRVFIKDGVTTTVNVYNRAGSLNSRLVLIYDTRGNLIEESLYGVSPDPLEKKTYNYDDRKKLKEEAKFKLNKITFRNTYEYNSAGQLEQIAEESQVEKKFIKKTLAYNADENVTEIKWRRKSSEDFNRITYQYDNRGLCVSAETYYPATKYRVLTKYEYEYY